MMEHEKEAMGYKARCRVAGVAAAYLTTQEFHFLPTMMTVRLMALLACAFEDALNHVRAPLKPYSD